MWPKSGAAGECPAVFSLLQPRNVAGFRGTVRYASVNAHKNRVSGRAVGLRMRGQQGPGQGQRKGKRVGWAAVEVGREVWGRGRKLPCQRP